MINFLKHPLLEKIISFIISIAIVIILFIGIVGIVFPLVLEAKFEFVRVISLLLSLVGAVIVLLARRAPLFRFTFLIKNPEEINIAVYNFIGTVVVGFSFIISGILYMRTKNPNMVIIPFIGGAGLIRVLIFVINNKIKKNSASGASQKKQS